ncbi:MAG: transporter substrate-binding domain-containing protein [Chloroflexi bacterium]|nr:transporter substrate-binding domain-containing protein [Chloroflexota bacterium]
MKSQPKSKHILWVAFSVLAGLALLLTACSGAAGGASTDPYSSIRRIQTAKQLKVGTGAGYYPFEMVDKQGNMVGFDMDIAQAMAKSLGVELKVVDFKDFDAILPALGSGQIDLILAGMTITPERALAVNFSQPYFASGQSVLVNKKHEGTVKTFSDLDQKGITIVTEQGTTGDVAAQRTFKNATIRPMKGGNEATLDVCNGSSDAFVYDQSFIAVQAMMYKDCVYPLLDPFTQEQYGIPVRAGETDLLQWVNTFLDSYLSSDAYKESYNKWFVSGDWLNTVEMPK